MDLLKCLLFILLAVMWAWKIPENFKVYRRDKSFKKLLPFLGKSLMTLASIILAIGVYV